MGRRQQLGVVAQFAAKDQPATKAQAPTAPSTSKPPLLSPINRKARPHVGPPLKSACTASATPSFRTEQANFFFRIRSSECVGLRREISAPSRVVGGMKSLFSPSVFLLSTF